MKTVGGAVVTGEFVSLGAAFAAQVGRDAGHLAVKTRSAAMSYADLDEASNRIAHAILAKREGVKPVAVFMQDRAQAIAAIFGVLKAGKIYMPLDPGHPVSRIEFMLDDAGADLVVTNNADLVGARSLGKPIINVDALDPGVSTSDPQVDVSVDTPAWILYTSGSTGRPKGVLQTHRNVLRFAHHYRFGLSITPSDRYVLVFSTVVNAGAHVIFSALLNGASVYPIDLKREAIDALPGWLAENRITLYYSVPTVFRHLVDSLDGSERFDTLRAVMLGGEPMYRRDVDQFRRRFSHHCVLINRLGSSETGTIRWWFIDPDSSWSGHNVPVGLPVSDHEIVIADEVGKPVDRGDVGEIVVRSPYLSPGYWRHPELTAKVFSEAPEDSDDRSYRTGDMGRILSDGRLVCLGRKDTQIKIRGYRVEPGEIEQALIDLPAVSEAFVMAVDQGSGPRLVAYLVPAGAKPVMDAVALRRRLVDTLPDYMLPDHYLWLDTLPMAPNGKIDRRALPQPGGEPDASVGITAPRDPVEEQVAAIWCEVLDVDCVGVNEGFFALGGNSLRATRVLTRIERDLGIRLPIAAMFNSSTVAALAELLKAYRDGSQVEYDQIQSPPEIHPSHPEPDRTKYRVKR